jgi:hypothetical protein
VSRDSEGDSVAVGYRPGIPPRGEDFTPLRRDYTWRDPRRLKDQRTTGKQLDADREKLDAQARQTPLPFRYIGKNGDWEEITPPPPAPTPSPPPAPSPSVSSAKALSPAQSAPPSPSLTPTLTPASPRHKRYLRRCPCEMCEARRAAG